MKKKKILSVAIAMLIAVTGSLCCLVAFGNDVNWRYDESAKTIYIYGSGKMTDYPSEYKSPWCNYDQVVSRVVIEDGVTSVGDYSFSGFRYLKTVEIADSVQSIGSNAFASCPDLNELTLNENITGIADSSFAFNGLSKKNNFVLNVKPSSFSLSYAINNNVNFSCESVDAGEHYAKITVGGMLAYFPFTPKYDCELTFYSGSNSDTLGYLYDSTFNLLAEDDDSGTGNNFKITHNLTAGNTYYLATGYYNTSYATSYKLTIEARYDCTITPYAMNAPSGEASSIIASEILINDQPAGDRFSIKINGPTAVKLEYNSRIEYRVISPGDESIVVMMCDMNNDGYVNAKDYAIMRKQNSKYKELYSNFINYQVQ